MNEKQQGQTGTAGSTKSYLVRLTGRESSCTTPNRLHCLAHGIELTEVIFAEVTVLVHFEVNSDLLNVQRLNFRCIAWVGIFTMLIWAFELFARVGDADLFG